ncbi:MAG: hypothetical protein E7231_13580 [Cellulosilyticum sp.]|nr:hypothetical protein [Cellulosilyticum sp.]
MKDKYKRLKNGILLIGTLLYTTGCSYFTSPTEIEMLMVEEQVETFYGEGVQRSYFDNELVQEITFKEWKGKNKKYRSEAEVLTKKEVFEQLSNEEITEEMLQGEYVLQTEQDTFNETQFIAYLPYKNYYCIKDMSFAAEVTDDIRLGMGKKLETGSLKEYVMNLINQYEKDYTLVIEDDVRMNNYITQHIIATGKDKSKNELHEFWVDQNTWLIVKEVQKQGSIINEVEYTKFELNPKLEDKIFEVNIPEGATVEYINDNLEKKNKVVSIDTAIKYLGSPIFYLREEQGIKLIETHYIESVNEQYGRVELTYTIDKGSKVVISNTLASTLYDKLDLGYERVTVRGLDAYYLETESMKVIEFIDQGMICDIYIKNSEMSREELIDLANQLELIDIKD